jgi:hypothetical protein
MGYCTRYHLEKFEGPDETAFCLAANGRTFILADAQKWYDHERDIVNAMRKTNAWRVEIRGHGEEQGDDWLKVFSRPVDTFDVKVKKFRMKMVPHDEPECSFVYSD